MLLVHKQLKPNRAASLPDGQCKRKARVTCRSVASVAPLTDSERGVLDRFKQGRPSQALRDVCLETMGEAANTKGVAPETLEGALLCLETLAAGASSPTPSVAVAGRWRLVFGTGTKIRAFQYIPVKEDFVLDPAAKTVALESSIGPFAFFIRGVMAEWRPEGGELDFQFTKVDVYFGENKIWEVVPKTKPKTYTFFFVGDKLAGARSSSGGVALLVK